MMKLRILSAVLFCLATLTLAADQQPAAVPKPPILVPQLIILDGDTPKPLALASVQVSTVIEGYTAQTTETLTFRNDFQRVLEGNLDFPLPAGATVCGFALDVDGVLVDGVPVPKDQARITFEKEERKGVDPGLLEHTVGNSYRMRIYPIRPRGTRTVRVEYVSNIEQDAFADENQPRAFSYRLPLRWSEEVGDFTLHVEVSGEDTAPQPIGGIAELSFENHDGKFVLDNEKKAIKFDTDLVITLTRPQAHDAVVEKRTHTNPTLADLQEKPEAASSAGDLAAPEYYFAINDVQPLRSLPTTQPATFPTRYCVCWDAGYTRAATDKTREMDALRSLLQYRPSVDLIVFSNTLQPTRHFDLSDGKIDPVLDAIKNLSYDGGTDLSKLSLNGKTSTGNVDCYLLFTDGLASFGGPMPVVEKTPVFTFSCAARANMALLSRIARKSGGRYYDLRNTNNNQLRVYMAGQSDFSLISVDAKPDEVAHIYPPLPAPTTGAITITGRLLAEQATITLNYGCGSEVLAQQTYTLKRAGAAETGLVPRLWAQMKLDDLETDADANASAISDLGRRFNLVTSNMSLLVLETLQQYVQYGIVPPASRKEIFNQFVDQLKQTTAQNVQVQKQRLDEVEKEWNERVAWWEKEYKYDPKFHYTGGQGGNNPGADGQDQAAHSPVDPRQANVELVAPRPAPAPATAAPAGQLRDEHLEHGLAGGLRGASPVSDARKNAAAEAVASGPSITIAPWNPDTPYLKVLKDAKPEQACDVYLQQREKYGDMPAFYLDCADYFVTHNLRDIGMRILTDIPALGLDSPELLRIAGYRFKQLGEYDQAIDLFEKVLRMRPEERQSYRDLGLALAARGESVMHDSSGWQQATNDFVRALHMLNEVVIRPPDQYPGIEVIALEEANRIINLMGKLPSFGSLAVPIDARFLKLLDTDIRVVMSWDTNNTDIDLWVTEPTSEKCFYQHNRTTIGGMLSNDITQGYGPEEYQVRKAMPGKYLIQANFFGSHQQALSGPTTIHCTVITNWGRDNEKRQNLTVRLENAKDVVDVGTVEIK